MKASEKLVGKRIELVLMKDDPNPVEPGTKGTVYHVGGGIINVQWDNGRNIGLVDGMDEYKILTKIVVYIIEGLSKAYKAKPKTNSYLIGNIKEAEVFEVVSPEEEVKNLNKNSGYCFEYEEITD